MTSRQVGKDYQTLQKDDYSLGKNAMYFLVSASNEQYQHTHEQLERYLTNAGCQPTTVPQGGWVVGTKL